jgi:hypothetical protein
VKCGRKNDHSTQQNLRCHHLHRFCIAATEFDPTFDKRSQLQHLTFFWGGDSSVETRLLEASRFVQPGRKEDNVESQQGGLLAKIWWQGLRKAQSRSCKEWQELPRRKRRGRATERDVRISGLGNKNELFFLIFFLKKKGNVEEGATLERKDTRGSDRRKEEVYAGATRKRKK